MQQTKAIVEEFRTTEGPNLQKEVEALDKEGVSYIAGLWDTMYLELRDPLPINTSPYLALQPDHKRQDPITRLGHVIFEAAKYYESIKSGNLVPDMEGGKPLDMAQHYKLFATGKCQ